MSSPGRSPEPGRPLRAVEDAGGPSAAPQADPRLHQVIEMIADTSNSLEVYDSQWRLRWVSDELKNLVEEHDEERLGYGKHMFEAVCLSPLWVKILDPDNFFELALTWTPLLIEDTPGGKETLSEIAWRAIRNWDPPVEVSKEDLEGWFEALEPVSPPAIFKTSIRFVPTGRLPGEVETYVIRLHDPDGEHFGFLVSHHNALPSGLTALLTRGDEGMFERMARLMDPGRKRAAILFADLQSSARLSRRLPTASFFRLIGELTAAIDRVVGDHGGVVGKHAGDGVTAFFLVDDLESPSLAARAALESARDISIVIRDTAKSLGEETGLIDPDDCRVNVAVHWGGTLYMGQLVTGGRLEITALGDEVNECARIQESAQEGETLVSKAVVEHLSSDDAAALEIDPDSVLYRTVSELPGASEKAKLDAGTIPVTTL
jgi:class 3 adenylate cyclase